MNDCFRQSVTMYNVHNQFQDNNFDLLLVYSLRHLLCEEYSMEPYNSTDGNQIDGSIRVIHSCLVFTLIPSG